MFCGGLFTVNASISCNHKWPVTPVPLNKFGSILSGREKPQDMDIVAEDKPKGVRSWPLDSLDVPLFGKRDSTGVVKDYETGFGSGMIQVGLALPQASS